MSSARSESVESSIRFKKQSTGAKSAVRAIFSDRKSTEVSLALKEQRNRELFLAEKAREVSSTAHSHDCEMFGSIPSESNVIKPIERTLTSSSTIGSIVSDFGVRIEIGCMTCQSNAVIDEIDAFKDKGVLIDRHTAKPFAFLCDGCSPNSKKNKILVN